jgi:hypothetical protein
MSRFREERAFGRSVGAVMAGIAALQLWRGRPSTAIAVAVIAVTLAVAGTFAPAVLVVPNRWWMRLARVLGWINSRVLLTVFFFLVITPAGLLMRLVGRDPLERRGRGSNWTPYGKRVRDPRHFERQF